MSIFRTYRKMNSLSSKIDKWTGSNKRKSNNKTKNESGR